MIIVMEVEAEATEEELRESLHEQIERLKEVTLLYDKNFKNLRRTEKLIRKTKKELSEAFSELKRISLQKKTKTILSGMNRDRILHHGVTVLKKEIMDYQDNILPRLKSAKDSLNNVKKDLEKRINFLRILLLTLESEDEESESGESENLLQFDSETDEVEEEQFPA